MEQGRSETGAYSLLALGCIFFVVGGGISSILVRAYLEKLMAAPVISTIIGGICVLWMMGCALLGICMALTAIPMIIAGAVNYLRARTVRIDTTIFSMVSQEKFCLSCNQVFSAESIFCSSCGARLKRRE
jgi:hypothetical protein